MVYKIGIIPVIVILSIGLLAGGAVLAQEVVPLATATGSVTPNDVPNDGTSALGFSWDIFDWAGTANSYTFQVNGPGQVSTPLYIQYSDGMGTDNFTPVLTALQPVNGIVGAFATHMFNPEGSGNTHDWAVPSTVMPGSYEAWVILNITGQPSVGAFISFQITQANGDLRVEKEDGTGAPLENWEFNIEGGDVYTNLNGATNSSGYYIFNDIPVGGYTVTETMKPNWISITPGEIGAPPYDLPATVVFDTTVIVTFVNEPEPGDLTIVKYNDLNGNGAYDGEPGLDGWDFDISGPINTSNTTSGGGIITLSGIPSGVYTVEETLEAGWANTDPGGSAPYDKTGIVVTPGGSTTVYFGNEQMGNLRIYKYNDLNNNGQDDSEPPLSGWGFTVSGVPGTHTTGGSGWVTVPDLSPGPYTVTETLKPFWVNTEQSPSNPIAVGPGETVAVVFGNHLPEREVPTLSQWGIIIMSAAFAALLVGFGVWRRRTA